MDSTLERLKQKELDIFKAFLSVCKDNNLKYYLLGGSCLGAVRHQGFIPWDDDIDVGLPREDYNSFIKIGQSFLPDYYFIQTFETDPEYLNCFAKIRDSRTTFIESSVKNWRINHGVYIDVFPLDFYPEHKKMMFEIKDLLLKARLSVLFASEPSLKMKWLQNVSKVLYSDVKEVVRARDSLMQSVPHSSILANICGAWGQKEITPAEWFGEGQKTKFEDLTVIIPNHYQAYLTQLYGDYMTPPPVEKRIGHHSAVVIDLDKPYTEYINRNQRS